MSVTVRIPTPLRRMTNGLDKVDVQGANLRDVIRALDALYPGIGQRICDDAGELRNFVNVYVDGEDVRFQRGMDTPTPGGAEVSVVPAVAGGAPAIPAKVRYFHYGR